MDALILPFTIVVDTREQFPFRFTDFRADERDGYLPLIVPTKLAGLRSGDYSIEGFENEVAIERKSLIDLYGTIGRGRVRFVAELERLAAMKFAAVVIEAGWSAIINSPPPQAKLSPKSVYRSVIAWQQRYPVIHWWACDTRNFAERTTLRMLERFYRDRTEEAKACP